MACPAISGHDNAGATSPTPPVNVQRVVSRGGPGLPRTDCELLLVVALLAGALMVGLATASDYGISIDEFNADDYGPKALAWYTSGFTDRSHFETVEFSLWYYGPWFHMLTSFVQSFDLVDRFTVRHAMTFLIGLGGLAALLPIGRLAAGRWAGLTAIALCLMTGYLYGSLFFTPIDVPFLAAMTWATLAILVMSRQVLPSWRAMVAVGVTTGLAIATRTGGIITQVYLICALVFCAAEFFAVNGRLTGRYLMQLGARYAAAAAIAVAIAIVLWPWLQVGNPLTQFMIAYRHFATIPMSYEFAHWGERMRTDALPVFYIPEQLGARLPDVFLLLLAIAVVGGVISVAARARDLLAVSNTDRRAGLRALAMAMSRRRGLLIVSAAVIVPIGILIIQRTKLYDGIRHVLFVIPMLAIVAGAGFRMLLAPLRRVRLLFAMVAGLWVGNVVLTLAKLHPLEYVAMNTLAGGTRGAYGRFELDYLAVAATEALRRLESQLEYERPAGSATGKPPSILICIPWRDWAVAPMLTRPWTIETDADKADFVIETERWRCAADRGLHLIDEVKRFDRPFAWTYARRGGT
jgi:hypothetical protein